MDRKEFIKTCGFAFIGGTVIATFLQSCASANYFAQSTFSNNQVVIKKSEFITMVKDKTVQRKYILLKTDKYDFPIGVYKHNEEEYSALLLKCTHKGCELNPQPDYLVCPCHGSEFTNKGIVQNPPAEQNLQTFKITTDNENIYVQL